MPLSSSSKASDVISREMGKSVEPRESGIGQNTVQLSAGVLGSVRVSV